MGLPLLGLLLALAAGETFAGPFGVGHQTQHIAPGIAPKVDAASDAAAVTVIAEAEGHHFSPASWTRHLRD